MSSDIKKLVYNLTPAATLSEETPVVFMRGWHTKSVYVLPVNGDPCNVTILGDFGYGDFFPFKSLENGTAPANKIFSITLDGDVLDKIKVEVTAGASAPDRVVVHVFLARNEG